MRKLAVIIPTALFLAMLALGVWKLWRRYHRGFTRHYTTHSMVLLSAPLSLPDGREFVRWDGCEITSGERGHVCLIDPDHPPQGIAPIYAVAPGKGASDGARSAAAPRDDRKAKL